MDYRYLFRAKRTDNGEWIVGSLIQVPYLGSIRSWISSEQEDKARLREISSNQAVWRAFEVRTDTICQYTGLTDKNGNKIWENDILRGHGNPKDLAKVVLGEFYVIEVESLENVDSVVGWHTEVIPTDAISKAEPFCLPMPLTDFYIKQSEWEVIGNTFDNADLLKGE